MNTNKKIAIFGPYPPPFGGISVHIKRLEYFLKKEKIDYIIFNHGKVSNEKVISTKKNIFYYIKLLFNKKYSLIHFHQFFGFHFIYYFIYNKINKTPLFITIHSERLINNNKYLNTVYFWFLKNLKEVIIISVSKKLNTKLNKLGVNSFFLPAYVPPKNINKKLIIKDNHYIYFLFSLWKINKELAENIYNVRIVFKFLQKNLKKYKMLFMIGNKENSNLNYLNKLIESYNLKSNIILIFNESLIDYVENCNFLIRANTSDGYGVSLQEAMDLDVPAIASDVCIRPKGTILFKNNNLTDMTEKINWLVKQNKKNILSKKENLNYHNELIDLYKKIP